MKKDIYILWFQGFNNAPKVVKKCLKSWKYYNADWNIIELDNNNLYKYVDISKYRHINLTALSDIIRVFLLNNFGGLWVDATTFCNMPLNNWLKKSINGGFFIFSWPDNSIYHKIATWFIYSDKKGYIIDKWERSIINYYKINYKPTEYFWVHRLFGELIIKDEEFRITYDKIVKLDAGAGPHKFSNENLIKNISEVKKTLIDSNQIQLYKMTYKININFGDPNLVANYILRSINRNKKATSKRDLLLKEEKEKEPNDSALQVQTTKGPFSEFILINDKKVF
jgi:hypothetical protein